MADVLPTLGQPTLLHGDCLDLLPTLEAESIDAVVTDPPAGIGFMHSEKAGRTWDSLADHKPRTERGQQVDIGLGVLGLERWARGFVVFLVDVFTETLRVVKPGAHALVWALPRTADLTMLALRLAGWEIRDSLAHLFGQGFGAKGCDVSKAIDKLAGADREVIGVAADFARDGAQRKTDGSHVRPGSNGTLERHGDRWSTPVTAPATEAAKRMAGWNTTLSPGHEQWILARAPMASTVARNVLEYGTGAINVDATRTGTGGQLRWSQPRNMGYHGGHDTGAEATASDVGRWPKNAMLSCSLACEGDRHTPWCPVGELDRQSGDLAPHGMVTASGGSRLTLEGGLATMGPKPIRQDGGGASRYFPRFRYEAKASDRSVPGREDLTNRHATIKSVALMRWMVRLITPPGGVVLDQFMGSGTTGVAVAAEGARFIGIERDADSFEVARARNLAAVGSPEYAAEANTHAPQGAQLGLL
jgi:DNA modification methylase